MQSRNVCHGMQKIFALLVPMYNSVIVVARGQHSCVRLRLPIFDSWVSHGEPLHSNHGDDNCIDDDAAIGIENPSPTSPMPLPSHPSWPHHSPTSQATPQCQEVVVPFVARPPEASERTSSIHHRSRPPLQNCDPPSVFISQHTPKT